MDKGFSRINSTPQNSLGENAQGLRILAHIIAKRLAKNSLRKDNHTIPLSSPASQEEDKRV
jgi:hypothetical protein